MQADPVTDILGLIDVQPTFMPGGELPVTDGDAIIQVINRLLRRFDHAFATQDWHPANHASFASAHPGKQPYDNIEMPYGNQVLWPDHGIAGTASAAIHPAIDQTRIEAIIRKGFRPALDSYSAFFENDRRTPTGLEAWLRQRGFSRMVFFGLAAGFHGDNFRRCVSRHRPAGTGRPYHDRYGPRQIDSHGRPLRPHQPNAI